MDEYPKNKTQPIDINMDVIHNYLHDINNTNQSGTSTSEARLTSTDSVFLGFWSDPMKRCFGIVGILGLVCVWLGLINFAIWWRHRRRGPLRWRASDLMRVSVIGDSDRQGSQPGPGSGSGLGWQWRTRQQGSRRLTRTHMTFVMTRHKSLNRSHRAKVTRQTTL